MKVPLQWMFCCSCICALSHGALAQEYGRYGRAPNSINITTPNPQRGTAQTNTTGDRFFHARSLVGQLVKDANGQTLGSIYDIAFNPATGDTFAAIGVGIGRYALVPWEALSVSIGAGGQDELNLNTTLRNLQAGPVIASNQWEKLYDPDFNRSIYRYFKQQPPTAIGGTQGEDLGGVSTGSSSGDTKEADKAP
jgi:hypothetical protein